MIKRNAFGTLRWWWLAVILQTCWLLSGYDSTNIQSICLVFFCGIRRQWASTRFAADSWRHRIAFRNNSCWEFFPETWRHCTDLVTCRNRFPYRLIQSESPPLLTSNSIIIIIINKKNAFTEAKIFAMVNMK